MSLNIRKETVRDYADIHFMVKSAFEAMELSDHDEHNLVARLRESDAYIPELSLVAELDGTIVGFIMFTKVRVGDETALALAPLAVAPAMQGKGIGGELIRAGHRVAAELGYRFSILVGHADYYPRFGYRPAGSFSIISPFDVPDEAFMAVDLQGGSGRLEGTVIYPKEFFDAN